MHLIHEWMSTANAILICFKVILGAIDTRHLTIESDNEGSHAVINDGMDTPQ